MKKYFTSLLMVFALVGVAFADGEIKKAIDVIRSECEESIRNIWWQDDVNSIREVIRRIDRIMENFDERVADVVDGSKHRLREKEAVAIDVDNVSFREEVESNRALIQEFERVRVERYVSKDLARRLLNENAGKRDIVDIAKRYRGQNAEFDVFIGALETSETNMRAADGLSASARLRSAAGHIAQRVLGRRAKDRSPVGLDGKIIEKTAARIAKRYVAVYKAGRATSTAKATRSLFLEAAKDSRWPRDLSNRVLDVDALSLYNGLRRAARHSDRNMNVPHISKLIVKAIRRAAKP